MNKLALLSTAILCLLLSDLKSVQLIKICHKPGGSYTCSSELGFRIDPIGDCQGKITIPIYVANLSDHPSEGLTYLLPEVIPAIHLSYIDRLGNLFISKPVENFSYLSPHEGYDSAIYHLFNSSTELVIDISDYVGARGEYYNVPLDIYISDSRGERINLLSYAAPTDLFSSQVFNETCGYYGPCRERVENPGSYSIRGCAINDDCNNSRPDFSSVDVVDKLETTKVYPNPFSDNITIDLANESEAQKITVYDVQGRVLESIEENNLSHNASGEISLNASSWQPSIYLVAIESKSHTEIIRVSKL